MEPAGQKNDLEPSRDMRADSEHAVEPGAPVTEGMPIMPRGDAPVPEPPAVDTPVHEPAEPAVATAVTSEAPPTVEKGRYQTTIDADGFTTNIRTRSRSKNSVASTAGSDADATSIPAITGPAEEAIQIPSQPVKGRRLSERIAAGSKQAALTRPSSRNSFSALEADATLAPGTDDVPEPAAPTTEPAAPQTKATKKKTTKSARARAARAQGADSEVQTGAASQGTRHTCD
jgi:hypothetical protein